MTTTQKPNLKKISLRRWYSQHATGQDQPGAYNGAIESPACNRLKETPPYHHIEKVIRDQRKENMKKARNNQHRMAEIERDRKKAREKHQLPNQENQRHSEPNTVTPRTTSLKPRAPNFPKLKLTDWKKENGGTSDDEVEELCTARQNRLLDKAEENQVKLTQRQEQRRRDKENFRGKRKPDSASRRKGPEREVKYVTTKKERTPQLKYKNSCGSPRKRWRLSMYFPSSTPVVPRL